MKSIKPGRGPSKFSAFTSVCAAIFGIFWIIVACSLGGFIMVPFGLIFIAIAIGSAVYNYKNATRKNRYSAFDIVDSGEEPDPLNQRYSGNTKYCPYCGEKLEGDFNFCPKCGREVQ